MKKLLVVVAIVIICGNTSWTAAQEGELSFEQLTDSLRQMGLGDAVSESEPNQGSTSPKELFQKLDVDGNGKLDSRELARARRISQEIQQRSGRDLGQFKNLVKQFDFNQDGQLGRTERAAARGRNQHDRGPVFDRVDRNDDGKIGPAEAARARRAHDRRLERFDHNDDGQLGPGERKAAKFVRENHDGSSAAGKSIPLRARKHADKNHDGQLNQRERNSVKRVRRSAASASNKIRRKRAGTATQQQTGNSAKRRASGGNRQNRASHSGNQKKRATATNAKRSSRAGASRSGASRSGASRTHKKRGGNTSRATAKRPSKR